MTYSLRNKMPWLMAALVLMLSACAGTGGQRSTGQAVDDTVLLTRVKSALVGNPQTKAHQIDIEVYQGDVQLNGFVDTEAAKSTATVVTKNVEGVKAVRNNLQLRAANRSAGEVVDDGLITARVKAALVGDPRTKAHQIEVTTNNGVVQLGGFVDKAEARSLAAQLAGSVNGVSSVSNGIQLR